ncbi:hypothetical protein TraAM80_09771 [Trypanosoma rangeli]|uniref:Uncharacterized protein n=1 Tax=Trypanosoma rangeli TaxID=5698 RepID=A0A3R7M063_TRYRA|nr:uncharacterized protein TraAM80_09771 [Trypanosoma rangeli]RNE96956.1 hypothetical protein TraAM80_09771 [Trypanosoma rangeli]|eukprot:RNE96956.1 hypothetical protein TraAM80_09771 [Trypanosoma rangeli]
MAAQRADMPRREVTTNRPLRVPGHAVPARRGPSRRRGVWHGAEHPRRSVAGRNAHCGSSKRPGGQSGAQGEERDEAKDAPRPAKGSVSWQRNCCHRFSI